MSTSDSKALVIIEEDLSPTRYAGINRGQLELLKRTLAKGATDDEFALFMNTAQRLKLDPFARQIYAVKRWDSSTKSEVMATQVAIDGYRAVADDSGEYDGREGPFWCGEDGKWEDVWISAKPPAAAKVIVYRKGSARGYVGVARYQSYVQTTKEGGPRATWKTMPDVMLAKCAEAQALRAAFPKQLSGTHTPDEIDDSEVVDMAKAATSLPAPAMTATASKPQTPADTWPAVLAELAPMVNTDLAKQVVSALTETGHPAADAPITEWTEAHVEVAMVKLLDDCRTAKDCNAKLGDWGRILNKHGRPGSRAAALFDGFNKLFIKKVTDLRQAEKAGGAGAAP